VRSKLLSGITLGVVAAFGVATGTEAQSQPSRAPNTYEQAAIKVVSDWTAAWQAKDPDKMASLVTDDIKFRLDPSEATFRTGRERFLCQMRQMAGGGGGLGGLIIKNPSYEAIGDKVYVLVIQRRTDVLQAPPGGRGGAPGAAGGPGGGGRGEDCLPSWPATSRWARLLSSRTARLPSGLMSRSPSTSRRCSAAADPEGREAPEVLVDREADSLGAISRTDLPTSCMEES